MKRTNGYAHLLLLRCFETVSTASAVMHFAEVCRHLFVSVIKFADTHHKYCPLLPKANFNLTANVQCICYNVLPYTCLHVTSGQVCHNIQIGI